MLWGYLIHLGFNMWSDRECPEWNLTHITEKPYLRCDCDVWTELTGKMVDAGIDMVVTDLGEGVKYESHPEIAVEGSWSVDELKQELARLRGMGLEPIPKLNFSTTHDAWLGPYSRCISTEPYYNVCRDLIAEITEIFDKPRFFHLGMDEETSEHQTTYAYALTRQHELWWHDFRFLAEQVEMAGSRAWIWSDYVWKHPDKFFENMPKSVLQSNWYYEPEFNQDIVYVKAYNDLEAQGYDQVPAGSNWSSPDNFRGTVNHCKANIAPERLLGFLQTVWRPTIPDCRDRHLRAIEQVAQVTK